jgi:hypothetical protein
MSHIIGTEQDDILFGAEEDDLIEGLVGATWPISMASAAR